MAVDIKVNCEACVCCEQRKNLNDIYSLSGNHLKSQASRIRKNILAFRMGKQNHWRLSSHKYFTKPRKDLDLNECVGETLP